MNKFSFVVVFTWMLAIVCVQSAVDHERRLLEFLEDRIPKHTLPSLQNDTVRVLADLFQIIDVDERRSTWTVKIWFFFHYTVPEVYWDPADYNGTWSIKVPHGTFWRPEIFARDVVETQEVMNDPQIITWLGLVNAWSSIATQKMSCLFDVTKFPFDQHVCAIRIEAWQFESLAYQLAIDSWDEDHAVENNQTGFDLHYFTEHEQWELLVDKSSIKQMADEEGHRVISIEVTIRRRAFFYCISIIYPNILLYALTTLTFFLPPESGEKVSLAITLLLAGVVNTGTMMPLFPRNSRGMPIMVHFSAISSLQMSFMCLFAVVVSKIHFHATSGSISIAKRVISSSSVRLLGFKPYKPCHETNSDSDSTFNRESSIETVDEELETRSTSGHEINTTDMNVAAVGSNMNVAKEKKFERAASVARSINEEREYIRRRFASVLDRIFLCLHVTAMIAVGLWFIVKFHS